MVLSFFFNDCLVLCLTGFHGLLHQPLRSAILLLFIITEVFKKMHIYDWAFTTCSMQLLVPKSMRPITAGVTSGGLTGLLVSLAKETLPGPTLAELDQVCAGRNLTLNVWGLELEVKSLVIGIFLGLFLGPVLEVICLLRQLGAIYLRRAFLVPAGPKPACRTWKVLDER